MPIIRGHHSFDDHFTQIPNAWVRDQRLSFKARGLLAELMSHRSGWSVSLKALSQGKDGRDAVRGAVNELIALGYLTRSEQRERDDLGHLTDYTYTTHDPCEGAENPMLENPTLDNPTTKKTITKEEQVKELKLTKGTRLSEEWRPTPDQVAWAMGKYPGLDIETATDNFVDYWTSKSEKATKLDWGKTWQVWIRNTASRAPRSQQPKQTNLQRNLSLVQRIAQQEQRLELES